MSDHIYDDVRDTDCNECDAVHEIVLVPGDADSDGKVNNRDLGLLQRYPNDWDVTIDILAMDITGDGRVNNHDLGLLQQYINEWDVELK